MRHLVRKIILWVAALLLSGVASAAAADVPVHIVIKGAGQVIWNDGVERHCDYPGCTVSVAEGSTITFSPVASFLTTQLDSWGGDCPSAQSPGCTITVTAETTIVAQFAFRYSPYLRLPGGLIKGTAVSTAVEQRIMGSMTGWGLPPYTLSIESGSLPPGLTLSSGGLLSGIPTALGVFSFTLHVVDQYGAIARTPTRWGVDREWLVTTSADAGGWAHVRTFRPGGAQDPGPASNFFAYAPPYGGGVRVAIGDVNEDAIQDVIAGAGAGSPLVGVFDGASGNLLRSFAAFPWAPADGVYVAAGDVNGDGVADIIAGAGGPAVVRVFNGRTGALMQEFAAAVGNSVRVAAADFNGDGRDDIVTGAGPGAPPWVRVYDAATGAPIRNILAYDQYFLGGVYVAAGDLTFDGYPEIVTGAGQGGGPHVKIFDASGMERLGFFAYGGTFAGGVRVAVGDVDNDGKSEIITAAGPGGGPHVRVLRPNCQFGPPCQFTSITDVDNFFAYAAFPGGVFVAAPAPLHRMALDAPLPGSTVSASSDLFGWAVHEGAGWIAPGGIGAVHVYAYPVSGGAPLFVGYSVMDPNPIQTPEQRHERPDLAAVLGGRYLTAGYKVSLSTLPPGTYDLVVFALNARTGTGVDQRVVRVTIQ